MRKKIESWKGHIARNFNQAANNYEVHSPIQKKSAQELASQIVNHAPARVEDILEFGCGTGHLTRALYPAFKQAQWVISDISPQMVAKCMQGMEESPRLTYSVMDAEDLNCQERFDLICSNLTAQWFTHTQVSIQKLISYLKPGGLLALSTLGPNTFTLWRACFNDLGAQAVMPNYPSEQNWQKMLKKQGEYQIYSQTLTHEYESALQFAKALKDIGAHSHSGGAAQLNPGFVRSVLRAFEARHHGKPVMADYDIITILFRKPAS